MNDNRDFQIHGITGYTVMSNYHLRDKSLSCKAKGLLSLMLSLPKEWDYSIKGLVSLSNDGRDSVKSALNELKDAQYISINEYRDDFGHFKYKYTVYYLPYPKWLEINNFTDDGFTASGEPSTENQHLLNTNNKILNNKKDKLDKTQDLKQDFKKEHNILTKELIRKNYISEDDCSSFLFDSFFEKLLKEGNSYKDLSIMTNYIVQSIKDRKFKDENYNDIENKYTYFRSSLLSNINKFKNMPDKLFEDFDVGEVEEKKNIEEWDWLNDNEEDLDL